MAAECLPFSPGLLLVACRIIHEVEGGEMAKLNVRSGFAKMRHRNGVPLMYFLVDSSLNCLQKSMARMPFCPSAGPTGGDGVALPAGTVNLSSCVVREDII